MKEDTDHRDFTRVPMGLVVDVRAGGQAFSGQAGDVSMNGLFVDSKETLPVGVECEVTLHLPGGASDLAIEARAVVTRTSAAGVGLEFSEIGPESYEYLRNLVLHNASDADVVEDELDTSVGLKRVRK